jgi:Uma2 family endonuclease
MNTHLRPSSLSYTTQAAEGMARRRWSVAEVEAAVDAGIFLEGERFELIGGEIVPMSPKGNHHETMKGMLNLFWGQRLPKGFVFIPETTFRMSVDTFVEPDFVFFRAGVKVAQFAPSNALLAVEVADTSLAYDRGRKAKLYASFGIPELWVIDAVKRVTHVYGDPAPDGYRGERLVMPDETLAPSFAPELAAKLGELDFL